MTEYRSVKKEHAVHLDRKTRPELLDLLKRQMNILANKKFVQKLPDGGERIKKLKSSIEEAIRKLDAVDDVTNSIRKLDISRPMLDDDDEPDVFATLATNGVPTKTIKNEKLDLDPPFFDKLTQQIEQKRTSNADRHERLPLNRSIRHSSTFKVGDNWNRIQGTWMETAATPPPVTFNESKQITLNESYELQETQAERQKELQTERASTYLMERLGGQDTIQSYDSSSFTGYREDLVKTDDDN